MIIDARHLQVVAEAKWAGTRQRSLRSEILFRVLDQVGLDIERRVWDAKIFECRPVHTDYRKQVVGLH